MEQEIKIEDILKSLRNQIGQQAQEIAILEATIIKLENPTIPTTTAVTDKPNVIGTQGIKPTTNP